MTRTRSWSRDSRLVQNTLLRLLGCSIALSCIISVVQFDALSRASELTVVTRPSALRGRETALALAVESKLEVASPEPLAIKQQTIEMLTPAPTSSRQVEANTASATERVDSEATHASDRAALVPLASLVAGRRGADGVTEEESAPAKSSLPASVTLDSDTTPLDIGGATLTEEHTREPAQVESEPSSEMEAQATQAPTKVVVRVPEPTVRVKRAHKGIIMCLFDRILPLGISLIRELRCLGNDELIEVYHCNELSSASVDMLHAVDENVKVIDVCQQLVENGVMDIKLASLFRSYWIKPLAVHQSELEEIILLDADDVLMRDPAVLRETAGYKTNGTLFFYDRVVQRKAFFNRRHKLADGKLHGSFLKHWLKTFNYARFNLTYAPSSHLLESFAFHGKTCHEQDSSMLLVNKRGAEKAMEVLWFLITEERLRQKFSWCVCRS